MPVALSPRDQQEAYAALGIRGSDLESIASLPLAEAEKAWRDLKRRAQKVYKRLAFELHPDRNGGNEGKTRLFSLLSRAMNELDQMSLPQRKPQVRVSCSVVAQAQASPVLRVNQRRNAVPAVKKDRAGRFAKMTP